MQGKKMEGSFEAKDPKFCPALPHQGKGKGARGPEFGSPQCCPSIPRGPEFDFPQCCRFVPATNPNAYHHNSWSAGFFDCHEDRCTCCMTAIAPCVAFGSIARFADDASALACVMRGSLYCVLLMVGLHCCYSCGYRERLRMKLQLPGNRTSDFLVHCLCDCCALCQEYHQVKSAKTGEAVKSVALSPPSIKTMIR
ncbi:hypothetical protein SUGI_0276200 [Cryptomeria japonica]|uniref:protein PLANT CADMIUM RESISTANCE 7 n=1 Tax=Cryptomeria japonica TaxID=3369 RepID=UPI002408C906|nr:protein PLANT CADMIUM RESISTANCE 7 [Cryptomeria japonica]GLJ16334.1 hypothetical protein SUGI_0276200 [Cryptomeria japonica]